MRISELEAALNYTFPEVDDYMTIGGLIYHQLGRIPSVGDMVNLSGARLIVMEMDNHRITKVKFQYIAKQDNANSDDTGKSEKGNNDLSTD
ncbi:MAG: hypothetical protein HQL58_11750 [Magnetococcales bacterium]|nr:hypothetical protein [Magnetococcales bacterium]